jgi:hypothetical protein
MRERSFRSSPERSLKYRCCCQANPLARGSAIEQDRRYPGHVGGTAGGRSGALVDRSPEDLREVGNYIVSLEHGIAHLNQRLTALVGVLTETCVPKRRLEQKYSWCHVPESVPVGFFLREKACRVDALHYSSCTSALMLPRDVICCHGGETSIPSRVTSASISANLSLSGKPRLFHASRPPLVHERFGCRASALPPLRAHSQSCFWICSRAPV